MTVLPQEDVRRIVKAALEEDIGAGDITSQWLIPPQARARMQFAAREEMVACGGFIPEAVYAQLDSVVSTEIKAGEGQRVTKGAVLAVAEGPAWAILAGERVALNLMQRMCGVATLTARYVEAVRGTKAVILDTRKTMPGLRPLDKYAVRTGGGQNHRMRLDDMVLIKDNHIALCGGVKEAVAKAKERRIALNRAGIKIVVECDTLSQVRDALDAMPDRILLDNMDTAAMTEAVVLSEGKVPLEASGGVSLDTVRRIAETGVDYISVGKLTHSALAADIGGDIVMA